MTKKGYNLFDVASALQKSVRKGLIDDALYWAFELYNSNFEKYLWKRLLIMTTEDVGLADKDAMQTAMLFYDNYKALKELDTHERVRPTMATVYVLVHAKKSGFLNWLWGSENDSHGTRNLPIPDYALDNHTRRGKAKGKTIMDFFNYGSLLANHTPIDDEMARKQVCMDFHSSKTDPKWTQCEFLPVGHPDRDPVAPKPIGSKASKPVDDSDDVPVTPVRRRLVKPKADDDQPTLL